MSVSTVSYDAIIAAFCLISYADGELHDIELSRFVETMCADDAFPDIDAARLTADIHAMIAELKKDFSAGRTRALARIEKVKNDFRIMNRVVHAARVALIADGRIVEAEELLLADIHRALGIRE